MILFISGLVTGWISLMALRMLLYRINKIALDAELTRLEDEELLKQYKQNG